MQKDQQLNIKKMLTLLLLISKTQEHIEVCFTTQLLYCPNNCRSRQCISFSYGLPLPFEDKKMQITTIIGNGLMPEVLPRLTG